MKFNIEQDYDINPNYAFQTLFLIIKNCIPLSLDLVGLIKFETINENHKFYIIILYARRGILF